MYVAQCHVGITKIWTAIQIESYMVNVFFVTNPSSFLKVITSSYYKFY